ncbi:lipoprotein [Paenibacillus silvae]|uniref:lipoprotein n=1 Tax=Paenibacillus silvae TaxID=1325358 RepID=UPI00119FF6F3|nr:MULTISPECIES: lipoprotein [Paenibacillus]MCK6076205.1 lipoprotein [Paenibacillus silvae]MCK6150635.1 lipoprotein [Paenibacillus silvae]MCK6268895.1 lipoprotein [Paenibacillus silvae]MCK6270488.1 lipoprotein [Paenibacillus silvae]
MKKSTLMFFLVFVLAGCSNEQKFNELTESGSSSSNDAKIQKLQNENKHLKKEIESNREKMNDEVQRDALRESLNLTFKLLSAMGDKDYDFIKSISSINVKISREQNILIVDNGKDFYEVAFQSKMDLEDLEFRGYDLKDEHHIKLMMARMFNQDIKGSEGHSALYFDFVRSEDGRWLLDGFMTN